MAPKKNLRQAGLLRGHLERISSEAFDLYRNQIISLVARLHGVYALYNGNRLYYVGLATNLRQRINHHLRDRHKKKWDRFSLYLVRKVDHLKELESLILHIAELSGNRATGRLGHSPNLVREFKRAMEMRDRRQREMILYGEAEDLPTAAVPFRGFRPNHQGKSYITMDRSRRRILFGGQRLRANYKGKSYTAVVRSSGIIHFSGKLFDSPSGAAHYIVKRPINGWWFWKARESIGKWVRLKDFGRR
ncbi:MAG: GIY-YIG nuclease family protein [Candidatus Binatia bacterium]